MFIIIIITVVVVVVVIVINSRAGFDVYFVPLTIGYMKKNESLLEWRVSILVTMIMSEEFIYFFNQGKPFTLP